MLSRVAVYGEPSRTTMVEDKVNDMSAAIPLRIARVRACPEPVEGYQSLHNRSTLCMRTTSPCSRVTTKHPKSRSRNVHDA